MNIRKLEIEIKHEIKQLETDLTMEFLKDNLKLISFTKGQIHALKKVLNTIEHSK